jgi:hypothetical protein
MPDLEAETEAIPARCRACTILVVQEELPERLSGCRLLKAEASIDRNREQLYYRTNTDDKAEGHIKVCRRSEREVTIDHVKSVCWHWNDGGESNNEQATPFEWYDTCQLIVRCRPCNSSKVGEKFKPQTGPNCRREDDPP